MKPHIFIGSSAEAKRLCGALQAALQHDVRVRAWHQVFPLSAGTLDTLQKEFSESDFAIFVFSPDDLAKIRDVELMIARDNVLFEAGLFMGMHGKGRTFIVTPSGMPDFHLPSDLLGFTTTHYYPEDAKEHPSSALGGAAFHITEAIRATMRTQENIQLHSSVSYKANATWPLKLNLTVTNKQSMPVLIESEGFAFAPNASSAPNSPVLPLDSHRPAFRVGVTEQGKDIYDTQCLLQPGKSIIAWVPFDPEIGEEALAGWLKEKQNKVGTWQYRCVWASSHPTARSYEIAF